MINAWTGEGVNEEKEEKLRCPVYLSHFFERFQIHNIFFDIIVFVVRSLEDSNVSVSSKFLISWKCRTSCFPNDGLLLLLSYSSLSSLLIITFCSLSDVFINAANSYEFFIGIVGLSDAHINFFFFFRQRNFRFLFDDRFLFGFLLWVLGAVWIRKDGYIVIIHYQTTDDGLWGLRAHIGVASNLVVLTNTKTRYNFWWFVSITDITTSETWISFPTSVAIFFLILLLQKILWKLHQLRLPYTFFVRKNEYIV